tara:strand:+ start:643 stop:900 length:258 start_codon:yes stop_codon:yes gene_type:complete
MVLTGLTVGRNVGGTVRGRVGANVGGNVGNGVGGKVGRSVGGATTFESFVGCCIAAIAFVYCIILLVQYNIVQLLLYIKHEETVC